MGKRKRCSERRRGVSEIDLSASDVAPSAECYIFRHGFDLSSFVQLLKFLACILRYDIGSWTKPNRFICRAPDERHSYHIWTLKKIKDCHKTHRYFITTQKSEFIPWIMTRIEKLWLVSYTGRRSLFTVVSNTPAARLSCRPIEYGTPEGRKCINSFSHFHHHVKAAFHGRMRSNFRSWQNHYSVYQLTERLCQIFYVYKMYF